MIAPRGSRGKLLKRCMVQRADLHCQWLAPSPHGAPSLRVAMKPMINTHAEIRTPHGTIGNAIRQLREKKGWTQEQLAKRIRRTQSSVAYYESGRICPSVKTAQLMAIEFNVPLEFIVGHRRSLFHHGP